MVTVIADNILSPLGATTSENLQAVRDSRTCLREHRLWDIPEPFVASLFADGQGERPTFEALVVASILRCLASTDVRGRVVLVLSSTKGQTTGPEGVPFAVSASRIVERIRPALPRVESLVAFTVSNACISGLSALIVARRLLDMGAYDFAIVAGCDVQSRFIVSGFQSFKAMSPAPCRPFDEDRNGLNLGEAAATIIFKRCSPDEVTSGTWEVLAGFMRNDAFHISGPSRTAEGSFLALEAACREVARPVCLSAHGTATLYNDDMESKAIYRAGLSAVPVTALKGYFGHTMGAAGILESILTMHALREGWIPGTLGFKTLGTSRPITVVGQHQPLPDTAEPPSFIKLMSGFGGCNAAMGFRLLGDIKGQMCCGVGARLPKPTLTVQITPQGATLCGETLPTAGATGKALLTALYKQYVGDYPKFYKMDILSRLGFMAAELLMQREASTEAFDHHRAVLLFGHTASQVADRAFEQTIQPGDNYFPSPADFVYTLPNIVTGEIAIRHQLHGETCYFALPRRDDALIHQLVAQAFADPATTSALVGWLDAPDENHFEASLSIFHLL
ncbi:MAG: 3-oxoacyl-ACP synthase [Bacteroidales bacterium]|nr:3-oxoacyl-ACP synthase [Bacteroidales bacterium]